MTLFDVVEYNEKESNEFQVTIKLNSEDIVLKAHFPGRPIVPGVTLLYIVKAAVEKVTGNHLKLLSLANAKFVKPITPGSDLIKVNISIQESTDPVRLVNADVFYNDELSAQFKSIRYSI